MSTNTFEKVSDTTGNIVESSKDFVGDHALSTTLAAFGIGLASGVAVVYLMSGGADQRSEAGIAHRLGRQVLDAMSKVMPDSVAQYRR